MLDKPSSSPKVMLEEILKDFELLVGAVMKQVGDSPTVREVWKECGLASTELARVYPGLVADVEDTAWEWWYAQDQPFGLESVVRGLIADKAASKMNSEAAADFTYERYNLSNLRDTLPKN